MKEKNNIFFRHLERFIFKYHLIKALQNFIIGISLILLITLFIVLFNYYTYPTVATKRIIFGFYILITSAMAFEFIILKIIPLFFKKKRISYKHAASIIIQLEPDFDDRLLSIIDLSLDKQEDPLINAAIDQKIKQLKFLDFGNILTINQINKSAKYLAITVIFLIILSLTNSNIIRNGTIKFVNYNKFYQPPAPFKFILLNKNLETTQDSDFVIRLRIEGKEIPKNVFIAIKNQLFIMPHYPKHKNLFYYTIKNPQKPLKFYFSAAGFNSELYTLKIRYMPNISSSEFIILPPRYTKLKKQEFYNVTNLVVPEGSQIQFILKTQNTQNIIYSTDSLHSDSLLAKKINYYSLIVEHPTTLKIKLISNSSLENDLNINIKTIPDLAPVIKLSQTTDTNNLNIKYFNIYISDDYGFSSLHFVLKARNKISSYNIPINQDKEQIISFGYSFDSITRSVNNINYYFIVCDNKTPHPNCSKTENYSFIKPTHADLEQTLDSIDNELGEKNETAKILAEQLRQMAQDYRAKLLTQNLSQWERKEATRQLAQKTNELKSLLDEIEQLNQKRSSLLNSFSPPSQQIEQKQKMLDELLNQVLNKNLRKLLKQLQQALKQEQTKIKPRDLAQLNQQYQMLSQKLNKTIDFFKKVAIQQKIEEQSKAIKDLSLRQDSVRQATKHHSVPKDKLDQKQAQIQKQLSQAQKQYQKAMEQNQTLQHPMPMQDLSESFSNIQQMMQQNRQLLNQGKRSKSRRLQSHIIDSLNSLSQKLSQNIRQAQAKAQMMDIMKIYKLISYMEFFSNNIEQTITQTRKLHPSNQSLPVIGVSIQNLNNQFSPIADSMLSLSSQNMQLANLVDDKIYKIRADFSSLPEYLDKRQKNMILFTETDILNNSNIVLLILTEVANSMEKQMQNAMPNMQQNQQGSQQAMMPLEQLQQQLQKQLEKLLEQAKQGKLNPKDLAQSLILKEKINFELQKLLDQYSNSLKVSEKLKEIQKISNQMERNLVDKQLDESVLKKAQLMKVKLWEAQNAIKKQNQYENKRIAEHQKQIFYNTPKKKLNLDQRQTSDYLRLMQLKTIKVNKFYYDIFKSYQLNK